MVQHHVLSRAHDNTFVTHHYPHSVSLKGSWPLPVTDRGTTDGETGIHPLRHETITALEIELEGNGLELR